MERRSNKQKLIRWSVSGVVILVLMAGSCLAGSLLAPRTGEASSSCAVVADTEPATRESLVSSVVSAMRQAIPHPTPTPAAPVVSGDADAEERLVAEIYEQVAPSVVHIRVVQHISGTETLMTEIPQIPGWPDFNFDQSPQEF
jgi:hypothetical protein